MSVLTGIFTVRTGVMSEKYRLVKTSRYKNAVSPFEDATLTFGSYFAVNYQERN